ncbi:hypothetical protein [Pedobacter sp.]
MKSIIFTLAILFTTFAGFSQNFREDFDYALGNIIGNNNTQAGTAWSENNNYPLTGGNQIQVVNTGLNFPLYNGKGNAILIKRYTDEGAGAQIPFKTGAPYIISSSATSGTIYVSFLMSISKLPVGNVHFFYLGNNSSGRGRILLRKASGVNAFNFGLLNNASGNIAWTDNSITYDPLQTYMVVLKYVRVASGNDQLSLFVFNSTDGGSLTEPATPRLFDDTHNQKPTINGIGFRQQSTSTTDDIEITVDGVNASTTWSGAVTLPVELTSFTAEKKGNGIRLNWATTSEANNSHFEVLRASDNLNFTKIGQVNGAGNSTSVKKYSFFDANPLRGVNYYQLKQVDYDGKFEKSDIVHETIELTTEKLVVASLADKSVQLSFHSTSAGSAKIQLHNSSGQTILNKQVQVTKGNNDITIKPSELQKGLLVISLATPSDSYRSKFIN